MAVSKGTRSPVSDTSKYIQKLFHESQVSKERELEWREAIRHAETSDVPLRFPVYECLYLLNIYTHKLVDLLKEIGGKFGMEQEDSLYHQFLIEQVRSAVSYDVLGHMAGVEQTDSWLFESLRRVEEKKLRQPDDVYYLVREREQERAKRGLPPLIRFLDEKRPSSKPTDSTDKTGTQKNEASRRH
jgi:hypothetical protein